MDHTLVENVEVGKRVTYRVRLKSTNLLECLNSAFSWIDGPPFHGRFGWDLLVERVSMHPSLVEDLMRLDKEARARGGGVVDVYDEAVHLWSAVVQPDVNLPVDVVVVTSQEAPDGYELVNILTTSRSLDTCPCGQPLRVTIRRVGELGLTRRLRESEIVRSNRTTPTTFVIPTYCK